MRGEVGKDRREKRRGRQRYPRHPDIISIFFTYFFLIDMELT